MYEDECSRVIRDTFSNSNCIFIPSHGDGGPDWCTAEQCLLGAHPDMRRYYPIDAIYRAAFGNEQIKLESVLSLFRDAVDIPRWSWISSVKELEWLRDWKSTDIERIKKQYELLDDETLNAEDKEELR